MEAGDDVAFKATAVVRWLLGEGAYGGARLTKTHALSRAVVRRAAERWPAWWNHELFGPPYREAELPVLQAVHDGLRRLRLMRRRGGMLHTTARGRELLDDPRALLEALWEDVGRGDALDAAAWPALCSALVSGEAIDSDVLAGAALPVLDLGGWRGEDGAPLDAFSGFSALLPLLCQLEGYGLIARLPVRRLTYSMTAAARALPPPWAQIDRTAATDGDTVLEFTAELAGARGVRARLAVLEHQHLTALHDAIQQAFGWDDDHLYSFWLDGGYFSGPQTEITTPATPDHGPPTADVPIAELDLAVGRRIGYVFDFGDEWRVALKVVARRPAGAGQYPQVLELEGTPPSQYGAGGD